MPLTGNQQVIVLVVSRLSGLRSGERLLVQAQVGVLEWNYAIVSLWSNS